MTQHRFTFPQVTELIPPRGDARPPDRPPRQRDLVAASLVLRPPKRASR